MPSYQELRQLAEDQFHQGETFAGLRLCRRLLDVCPTDYQLRLHVGDALARLGQRPRARQVFASLTVLHLNAGRTLPALVAAWALDEVDPGAVDVFGKMAKMYGAGAERVRLATGPTALPPLPEQAEVSLGPAVVTPAEILQTVTAAAATLQGRVERVGPLPPLPIFSDLQADDVLQVLRAMRRVRFARGARILSEGEPGATFYLIAHGTVRVARGQGEQEVELARLSQGAVLGEMALVRQAPRFAGATALTEVDGLEVPYPVLQDLARRRPGVAQALQRFTRQRLLRSIVARSLVLRPFYPDRFERLLAEFRPRTHAPGEALLREGDPGEGLHVLLAGEVDVFRWDGSRQVHLARLGAAEVVGEMSLLDDQPVSATVVARGEGAQTLFLARPAFARLVADHPGLIDDLRALAETRRLENLLVTGEREAVADGEEVFL